MVNDRILQLHDNQKVYPWSQIFAVLIVCLSSFGNGLQFAWTSPFIPILISKESPIPMSFEEASYFTVIPAVTAIIASPVFAALMNTIGRKSAMLLLAIPQLTAWTMIAFSDSLIVLYIARAMSGIAEGGSFTTISVYIGEILEPKFRGSLGSFLSFSIYFGQFLMNVVGSYASMHMTARIFAILPIAYFTMFSFMPESPYYLLMKNKREAARNALRKLRTVVDVDDELTKLTADVERQISESSSFKDLFIISSNRRAMFIATGLRIAQQLSGITAFSFYTQYVFEKAGSNLSKSACAMIFTGLQALIVCFVPFIVDKCGRRPLMILSCSGCAILLSIETIYFYFSEYTDIDVSFLSWVPVTGMMLYIIVFCVGFGIVPTLMLSELFSTSIKGKALCCMSLFYAFCVSVTSKMFQLMADNFGLFAPFCLFTICCFISIFFSYYCVPETKGKTLEEIQQYLKTKKTKC